MADSRSVERDFVSKSTRQDRQQPQDLERAATVCRRLSAVIGKLHACFETRYFDLCRLMVRTLDRLPLADSYRDTIGRIMLADIDLLPSRSLTTAQYLYDCLLADIAANRSLVEVVKDYAGRRSRMQANDDRLEVFLDCRMRVVGKETAKGYADR